jgi:hypothetical protein
MFHLVLTFLSRNCYKMSKAAKKDANCNCAKFIQLINMLNHQTNGLNSPFQKLLIQSNNSTKSSVVGFFSSPMRQEGFLTFRWMTLKGLIIAV